MPRRAAATALGPVERAWLVYVLRCRDGSLYTGVTNDLERRLAAHRAGRGSRYVASRLPAVVVYREPAGSRSEALRREAAIKRLPRARKLALVGPRSPRSRTPFVSSGHEAT